MPYGEVKLYTDVYDLQHTFEALQERAAFTSAIDLAIIGSIFGQKNISSSDSSDAERRLAMAMANITGMQQIAHALSQRYEQALQRTGDH